ncbi:MAG: branched-chain amino acid ABC transporter permease [Methyloceanibacter sp.]
MAGAPSLTPTRLLLIAGLLACGVVAPLLFPAYQLQFTELLLFIVFALAWDLVGGQMGYNSFGNVLFVGVGMYVAAIVQVGLFYDVGLYNEARGGGTEFTFDVGQFVTGLALGLPAAALAASLIAWLLGSLVLSMRGHYFAICTLGLGIAAGQIAAGIPWLGGGSGMLTPNPPLALGDVELLLYYLSLAIAVLCALSFAWLLSTRFGLALNAIRDDEDKAEAMGLRTHAAKVTAWTIAAAFIGAAGALYGNVVRFIDPVQTAFAGPTIGVWMILMALLGGKGTLLGPIVGAIVFQLTKELFWTYLLGWQRVALGVLIVAVAVFFPTGIVGFIRGRFDATRRDSTQDSAQKMGDP